MNERRNDEIFLNVILSCFAIQEEMADVLMDRWSIWNSIKGLSIWKKWMYAAVSILIGIHVFVIIQSSYIHKMCCSSMLLENIELLLENICYFLFNQLMACSNLADPLNRLVPLTEMMVWIINNHILTMKVVFFQSKH